MDDQQTTEPNNTETPPEQNESTAPEIDSESTTADSSPDTKTVTEPDSPATVTSSSEPASSSPAEVVTSGSKSGKKSKKRGLLLLLVIIILVVVGYVLFHSTKSTKQTAAAVKKDIPLLRVGIGFPEPTAFYPTTDDTGTTVDVNHQLFEGLTAYQDGTKVVPQLAKSWTNPDTNTWVFALQHGVKFHDGNLMTATEVAASINQVLPTDYGQEFANTIKSVAVVDDYTVKITTTSPDSLLPNKLTFLDIFDTSDTTKSTQDNAINGTGPYIIKPGTTPTTTETDMVANPDYWGGHVYTRELVIKSYNNNSDLIAALNKHQLDMGGNVSQADLTGLNTTSFKTFDIPGVVIAQLVPNTLRGGPLANVKVRNALWLALDPAAIAKAHDFLGTPVSQIVPPQIPGYDPSLTRPATDPVAAKQQIAAAGYPNGFSFTLTYFSPAADSLALEVQKELKVAGVTVVLDPQTDGQALAAKALGGQTDMFYNTEASDLLDGSDIMQGYVQQPFYDNPKLDALYTQASQTLDPAKRLALLQQMSDLVYTDKATLPLYDETVRWVEAKSPVLHLTYQEIGGEPGINFSKVYTN